MLALNSDKKQKVKKEENKGFAFHYRHIFFKKGLTRRD